MSICWEVNKDRNVGPKSIYCWVTAYDAGPTLNQHWANILRCWICLSCPWWCGCVSAPCGGYTKGRNGGNASILVNTRKRTHTAAGSMLGQCLHCGNVSYVSEWVNLALHSFLHIMAISRKREARCRDYALLLTNDFLVHSDIDSIAQSSHLHRWFFSSFPRRFFVILNFLMSCLQSFTSQFRTQKTRNIETTVAMYSNSYVGPASKTVDQHHNCLFKRSSEIKYFTVNVRCNITHLPELF